MYFDADDFGYYKPHEAIDFIDKSFEDVDVIKTNKKYSYFNCPCAFDIETSSYRKPDGSKAVCMYVWQLAINGYIMIGRTWEEWVDVCQMIIKRLELNEGLRLVIFVHNLSYEFSFICHWLEWTASFCLKEREPIYVRSNGLEFRCSYILSGCGLAKVGNDLQTYKVKKLDGDLDYNLIRHSDTPLTDKELAYCINDVKVVMAYIQEKLDNGEQLHTMPLTNTGYVRKYTRNMCFYGGLPQHKNNPFFQKFHNIIKHLTLGPEEYKQLLRAFAGGFTHTNCLFVGMIIEWVMSWDFTSSYPYVMLSELFPVGPSRLVNVKNKAEMLKYFEKYCCLFELELTGVKSKWAGDHFISESKCYLLERPEIDNGRIVNCDRLRITVTEQDYKIFEQFYTWDKERVTDFRVYRKGYLPKQFILAILKLYEDKTTLKDVEGAEVDYLLSKGMLNSTYGMMVTKLDKPIISYDESEEFNWHTEVEPLVNILERYNNSRSRFTFYPQGVWVTAYSRANLATAIKECGNDYIYADTDSVKIRNYEKHKDYFDNYNRLVRHKLKKMCDHYDIPFERVCPKTKEGKEKLIGVWDFDGKYKRFCALGAKRYMVESEKGYSFTISGCNKKKAVPYLVEKFGDPFKEFKDGMYIPKEYTGKMTHTYIDEEIHDIVTDYKGNKKEIYEKSGVHLEPCDFTMSLADSFIRFLNKVQEVQVLGQGGLNG